MPRFFLVANAGRSGSTYLFHLLQSINQNNTYVAHEDIPVQVTKPRYYNRAYDKNRQQSILEDEKLRPYMRRWEDLAKHQTVIETGWTSYHLLPILYHLFGSDLGVVVLHRNPWEFALSRANMGNYHPRSWYDDAHEVSPFDPYSICTSYKHQWPAMNFVERCLFWWFVCYQEIFEFIHTFEDAKCEIISFEKLRKGDVANIFAFFDMPEPERSAFLTAPKNPVHRFMRETFPVKGEWKDLSKHKQINLWANSTFGYTTDCDDLQSKAQKYTLPRGVLPKVRHSTGFWSLKRKLGHRLQNTTAFIRDAVSKGT